MVNNYGNDDNQVVSERDRFRPNWLRGQVVTQKCSTTYRPIYDKGAYLTPFEVLLSTCCFFKV